MSKKIEKLVQKVWATNDLIIKRDIITKIVAAWKKPKSYILRAVTTADAKRLDLIAGNLLLQEEDIAVIR